MLRCVGPAFAHFAPPLLVPPADGGGGVDFTLGVNQDEGILTENRTADGSRWEFGDRYVSQRNRN